MPIRDRITLADIEGYDFLSAPETAQIMRVDPRTVRQMIENGAIPATKMGAEWRVSAAWVREQAGLPASGQLADVAEHRDDEPFMDVITHRMITWGEATPEQRLARERWLSELAGQPTGTAA